MDEKYEDFDDFMAKFRLFKEDKNKKSINGDYSEIPKNSSQNGCGETPER